MGYVVLELPLVVEEWQKNELLKKMECARRIYNDMLSHNLKRYNEIVRTKRWRELSVIIKEELAASENDVNGKKKKSPRLKSAYEDRNAIIRENGFSEFDFVSQSITFSKYYQKHISSNMASLSVAKPMWSAFEKLLFGKADKVHFKKAGELLSIASNNKSGIRFVYQDNGYHVIVSNIRAGAKTLCIQVKNPHTDYEKELLYGELKNIVKVARIIHKPIKGRDAFFVQLTLSKDLPIKYLEDGSVKHPIGTGKVGVAIWRDELYAVSNTKVYHASIIPVSEQGFCEKQAFLTRELEHLRRIANPQNYDVDGLLKRGIIVNGRRRRLRWHLSENYKKTKLELQELYRKHDKEKELLRHKIVWDLLSMGNEFCFADTSFLTMKPEWDEEKPLPNTEYQKKKQRRKAIQSFAPAALLSKLEQRIINIEGGIIEKKQLPEELYWYQHDKGVSDKDLFSGDKLLVDNKVVPHTAYRAFLIRHLNMKTKVYEQKALAEEFDNFVENLSKML